jgi:hypothetical protein
MRRCRLGRWSAQGVVLVSGHGSVVTGIFYSHPGGGFAFLGQSRPSAFSVPAVDVELERPWSPRVSVGRLTVLPVLRPSSS